MSINVNYDNKGNKKVQSNKARPLDKTIKINPETSMVMFNLRGTLVRHGILLRKILKHISSNAIDKAIGYNQETLRIPLVHNISNNIELLALANKNDKTNLIDIFNPKEIYKICEKALLNHCKTASEDTVLLNIMATNISQKIFDSIINDPENQQLLKTALEIYEQQSSKNTKPFITPEITQLITNLANNNLELENTLNGLLYIGYSPAGPNEFSNGAMDDLRMYCRALTATEISTLYNSPSACSCLSPANPGVISGSTTACMGSSGIFSVLPVNGASSYQWTLPNGWTGNSTTNSIAVTLGSNNGNVSVVVSNSCGTSPASTLSVLVNLPPVKPNVIAGNSVVCVGSAKVYSVLPVNGATTYSWVLSLGWTGTSSTNIISVIPTVGSGTISVSSSNNCGSSLPAILVVKGQECATGIDETNENALNWKIYPNPNNGNFSLDFLQFDSAVTILIVNGLGEVVYNSFTNESKIEINTQIISGVYIVKIIDAKTKILLGSKKLVIY
jgi:hypothetical protein